MPDPAIENVTFIVGDDDDDLFKVRRNENEKNEMIVSTCNTFFREVVATYMILKVLNNEQSNREAIHSFEKSI